MIIMVVDGQGGGIGRALIEGLQKVLPEDCTLIATGTNSIATSAMRKAGCEQIATGDNAIIYNAARADIIVGSLGIIAANSIMGELSPTVANAIASSDAEKVLIPVGRCKFHVACVTDDTLPKRIERAVNMVVSLVRHG